MDTIRLPPDFSEFLKLLLAHDVRFLLIGGYAVNAFGYSRNTGDMDVWIASDRDNLIRVVSSVREFGFVNTPDHVLDKEDAMLRMGVPPLRIEVLKRATGVNFEDCWNRRTVLESGEKLLIPMISLDDLKQNKRAAGRPKDLLDVEELS